MSGSLFGQCPDTSDQGNCDTLFVTGCYPGPCSPGTEIAIAVWAYHDEFLPGVSIPLKYKNPQTDIFLDSAKLTSFSSFGITSDTVIDRSAGTIIYFFIGITGGTLPPGTDTFMNIYFRTGTTSWDPSISQPIDTFTIGGPGGQGLAFVDTAGNYFVPYLSDGFAGPCICSDVKEDNRFPSTLRPSSFSLSQNYPNPFNTETVITFALPHASRVRIEIFNILGQRVRDLVDEQVSSGYKKVVWDGKDNRGKFVTSGIYFYRITTDEFVDVRKMALLK